MKQFIFSSTVFSILFAGSLYSQPRFEVPFEFKAGGKVMPAGTYRVNPANHNTTSVFQFTNTSAGQAALISFPMMTEPEANARPKLVFHCNDGDCEIAGVWAQPGGAGAARKTKVPQSSPVMVGGTD